MNPLLIQIALSNRERIALASLMCLKELTLANLDEIKAYNALRRGMGLRPIMDAIINQHEVEAKTALDPTRYRFIIPLTAARFAVDRLTPFVTRDPNMFVLLGEVLEDMDSPEGTPDDSSIVTPDQPFIWSTPSTPVRTYQDLAKFLGIEEPVDLLHAVEELVETVLPAEKFPESRF